MFKALSAAGRYPFTALASAVVLTLAACGGGGASSGAGTLQMSLTDAPACGYDAVNVTIAKLSVNQSGTASATDAGWVDIPITAQRIDLLTLQNGVLATLGQTPLAPGKYTQMRLLLADNASAGAGQPIPNSVLPTGGSETALTTPSGQQTGLKLNVDIDIAADKMADFVIDFNACKSIVSAGASGKYLLKPVVSVTPNFVSGVKGTVDASIASGTGTAVMLEQPGTSTQAPVVVKATAPDSTGNYVLGPVAPGTYDLVVTSNGHATAVVTGVVVQDGTVTTIGGAINPPLSATGTISGLVATGATPIDASLAVTQALTGGSTIELAGGPADSASGAYAFSLPVGAVSVAPYTGGALTFAADAAAPGKYTVAATSGGVTKPSSLLTVTAGATVTAGFSFP
ncbi:MAG TPA: DUF4382 domain-containing protein [Burkholderiaceae bacterium]|nr:DUF4382 domain-containing protein [Burkholderiaceae bacterium]